MVKQARCERCKLKFTWDRDTPLVTLDCPHCHGALRATNSMCKLPTHHVNVTVVPKNLDRILSQSTRRREVKERSTVKLHEVQVACPHCRSLVPFTGGHERSGLDAYVIDTAIHPLTVDMCHATVRCSPCGHIFGVRLSLVVQKYPSIKYADLFKEDPKPSEWVNREAAMAPPEHKTETTEVLEKTPRNKQFRQVTLTPRRGIPGKQRR